MSQRFGLGEGRPEGNWARCVFLHSLMVCHFLYLCHDLSRLDSWGKREGGKINPIVPIGGHFLSLGAWLLFARSSYLKGVELEELSNEGSTILEGIG